MSQQAGSPSDLAPRSLAVMGFTLAHGRIVEIDVLSDPKRLQQIDLTALES